MKILLNGEEKAFDNIINISDLLQKLNLDARKIAIEVNLEIVPKSLYKEKILTSGDKVEIVNFIAGG